MGGSAALTRWRERNPEAVEQSLHEDCPTCKAMPGQVCMNKEGLPFKSHKNFIHIPRLEKAHKTNLKKAKGGGAK